MRASIIALVVASVMAVAGPASGKAAIEAAVIVGPGLPAGLPIAAPATEGLWQTGIGVTGGLDYRRAGSAEELGLAPGELGPRYLVLYRFFGGALVRQYLYPYAPGGPVSFTPSGQVLRGLFGDAGDLPIVSGWHHGSPELFDYLVGRGFPELPQPAEAAGWRSGSRHARR